MSYEQLPDDKRTEVLERDGHECQFCGMDSEDHKEQNGRDLHVHHIVPQRSNGEHLPKNLITVCRNCHSTLEHTQANAIEQFHNDLVGDSNVESLESEVEKLSEELADRREGIRSIIEEFDELAQKPIFPTVYVVHNSEATTSRLLYVGQDKEKAFERFSESGKNTTMETTSIKIDGWVSEFNDAYLDDLYDVGGVLRDRIKDIEHFIENDD